MSLLDGLAPDLWQLVLGRDEPGGTMARNTKADTCTKCGGWLLHGLDADWGALDTYADPEPLSALGEVQAAIAGLRTFELHRCRGGYELDRRCDSKIRFRPAGSGKVDVLAEHRCGVVLDRAPPVLRLSIPSTATAPPF